MYVCVLHAWHFRFSSPPPPPPQLSCSRHLFKGADSGVLVWLAGTRPAHRVREGPGESGEMLREYAAIKAWAGFVSVSSSHTNDPDTEPLAEAGDCIWKTHCAAEQGIETKEVYSFYCVRGKPGRHQNIRIILKVFFDLGVLWTAGALFWGEETQTKSQHWNLP